MARSNRVCRLVGVLVVPMISLGLAALMYGCGGKGGGSGTEDVNTSLSAEAKDCSCVDGMITVSSGTLARASHDKGASFMYGDRRIAPEGVISNPDGSIGVMIGDCNKVADLTVGNITLCRDVHPGTSSGSPAKDSKTTCVDNTACASGEECKSGSCVAPAAPGDTTTTPSGSTGGTGATGSSGTDETITPEGASGTATDTDGDGVPDTKDTCVTPVGAVVDATGCPPPPDDDGDGVPNTIDTCPDTAPGTAVDAKGCALPPPVATGTLEVTPVTETNAALSTIKIKYTAANAKAVYIWSNDFNRTAVDDTLDADKKCKKVGTEASDVRYLATGPQGNNINQNLDENATTDNLKKKYKMYLEGILCNNENAETTDDCLYQAPADPKDAPKTAKEASVKAYKLSGVQPLRAIGEEVIVGPILPILPVESNPECRIDLKRADGGAMAGGEFYTRSWVHYGKVCLVVQDQSDAWKAYCQKVEAPKAEIIGESAVKVSEAKPVVTVDFTYSNAVSVPAVAGCTPGAGSDAKPDGNGSGRYVAECEIKKIKTKIDLAVTGIGALNSDKKSFEVNLLPATAKMSLYGAAPCKSCSAEFDLGYKVSRPFEIKNLTDNTVTINTRSDESKWVPWVRSLDLFGQYMVDGKKQNHITAIQVKLASDAEGRVTAYRDPTYTFWSFGAYDFDGGSVALSNVIRLDYEYSFTFAEVELPMCYYDDEGADESVEAARNGQIKLTGKNLKSVSCSCSNGLIMNDSSVLQSVTEAGTTVVWQWGNGEDRDDDIWWNCTCTAEFLGPAPDDVPHSYSWTWCCEGDDFNQDDRECPNRNYDVTWGD